MPDATLLHNVIFMIATDWITDRCSPVPTVPMVWVNICTPLWLTPTTYLTLYETMYLPINDPILATYLATLYPAGRTCECSCQNSFRGHRSGSRRLRLLICCVYFRFLAVSVVLIRIKYLYNLARTCVSCLIMNSAISFIRNSVTNLECIHKIRSYCLNFICAVNLH